MDDEVLALVEKCAREVADEQDIRLPSELGPDTSLLGEDGLFDSLALVNLVLSVEESIGDVYGVSVTLADERALSQERSPFRSLGSLAVYAWCLLEEHRAAS